MQGQGCRGLDHQGRAYGENQVRLKAEIKSLGEDVLRELLPERDRGRFQKTSALVAQRDLDAAFQPLLDQVRVVTHVAFQANAVSAGPVQLEHALAACVLVEAVDVLRNDRSQLARGFQGGQGAVSGVGLCALKLAVGLLFHLPVLAARVSVCEKVLKEDGLVPAPDSARAAEIRNPALCADPRSGERNGFVGLREVTCNLVYHRSFLPRL